MASRRVEGLGVPSAATMDFASRCSTWLSTAGASPGRSHGRGAPGTRRRRGALRWPAAYGAIAGHPSGLWPRPAWLVWWRAAPASAEAAACGRHDSAPPRELPRPRWADRPSPAVRSPGERGHVPRSHRPGPRRPMRARGRHAGTAGGWRRAELPRPGARELRSRGDVCVCVWCVCWRGGRGGAGGGATHAC